MGVAVGGGVLDGVGDGVVVGTAVWVGFGVFVGIGVSDGTNWAVDVSASSAMVNACAEGFTVGRSCADPLWPQPFNSSSNRRRIGIAGRSCDLWPGIGDIIVNRILLTHLEYTLYPITISFYEV